MSPETLNECGRYAEALALARARPDLPGARTAAGWALENLGRPAEALAAYEAALDADPDDLWALEGSANVLRRLGRPAGAVARWTEAVRRASRRAPDAETLELLGWSEHRLGRHAAALATFRRALALEPDRLSVRFDVALVLLHLGRAEDALATYVAAASAIPADDERGAAACAVAADDLREAIAEGTVGDVPLVRRALAVLQNRAALPNIRQGAA